MHLHMVSSARQVLEGVFLASLSWTSLTVALPFTAAEWDGVALVVIGVIFVARGAGEA